MRQRHGNACRSHAAGAPGNAGAGDVVLDADGSRAAFASSATNLGATGKGSQVHRKDLVTGGLTYVSVPAPGAGDQDAYGLSIDATGDHVSWHENSATFGYGADGRTHVFVRDITARSTLLASTGGPPARRRTNTGASSTTRAPAWSSGAGRARSTAASCATCARA